MNSKLMDEDALRRFEASWRSGQRRPLEHFLPPTDQPAYLEILAALVDLEMRLSWEAWRSPATSATGPLRPPLLETYLQRYPPLNSPPLVRRLAQREYLLRHGNGDSPSPDEYCRRFPEVLRDEHEVRSLLNTHDQGPVSTVPSVLLSPLSPAEGERALPESFGRYRIIRKLGAGGMGTVYLAHDSQLDRAVALKVPHFSGNDPKALERFRREARAAARLHHRNLCSIHDIGEIDGAHFLTMDYIEGRTLAEALRNGPSLRLAESVTLVSKVARAMSHAHAEGVIHRDLKPANIMVDRQGEPIVMDFGLARRAAVSEVSVTADGALIGTPAFMSPEQARGDVRALGPATDIYSLGVVLYELLTGQLPFRGPAGDVLAQIVRDAPRPPSAHRANISRRLDEVCLRALAKRPEERFPSMEALAEALAEVEHSRDGATTVPLQRTNSGKPRRKSAGLVVVSGALAVLVMLSLALALPWVGRGREGTLPIDVTIPQTTPLQTRAPDAPSSAATRTVHRLLKEALRFEGHMGALSAVGCGGGDLNAISTSKEDNTFRVWSTFTGKEFDSNRWQFPADSFGSPTSCNADGGRWTYMSAHSIKVIDSGSGKELRSIDIAADCELGEHALSTNGRWVGVSVYYHAMPEGPYALAVNVETGKMYWFRGHKGGRKPESVIVSPDGTTGASAGADGLYIWDVIGPDSAKQRNRIDRDAVICMAFAPDGEALLAGERANALILWDARTGDKRLRFEGHIGPVNCVTFSSDGQWALSGGADHTARLWEVKTGKELARLEGHQAEVTCVAFVGHDKRVLTGSTDKTMRLWDLGALEEPPARSPE